MAFEDLRNFFEDFIDLPIGGKVYRIPGPDASLGLWIQTTWTTAIKFHLDIEPTASDAAKLVTMGAAAKLSDEEEDALYRRWFPDTYDQMIADGVSHNEIALAGKTAFVWVGSGDLDLAEKFWRAKGDPKASAPTNREARRAVKGSMRTAGATTTKPRVSTSTTKSAGKRA